MIAWFLITFSSNVHPFYNKQLGKTKVSASVFGAQLVSVRQEHPGEDEIRDVQPKNLQPELFAMQKRKKTEYKMSLWSLLFF